MQGFNMGRYVPPDLEGLTTGNKLHKKHPLGTRASKLSQGLLTVRFEMPYAIWCSTCPKPTLIGQGVRFNAEKKKVGNYHTTPIWSFRFRHTDCGGLIEMRTDPQNTAYVVESGARKRDTGDDRVHEGELVGMSKEEREVLLKNAFAGLEKTIEHRDLLKGSMERIDALEKEVARHWDDPFTRNQALRRTFRAGRKEREKEAAVTEALQAKMGLGIDLVPATEEDARRAALVDFGAEGNVNHAERALAKPLFGTGKPVRESVERGLRSRGSAAKSRTGVTRKEKLRSEIVSNTRLAQDPFLLGLVGSETSKSNLRATGVKRKRPAAETPLGGGVSSALVAYDSD